MTNPTAPTADSARVFALREQVAEAIYETYRRRWQQFDGSVRDKPWGELPDAETEPFTDTEYHFRRVALAEADAAIAIIANAQPTVPDTNQLFIECPICKGSGFSTPGTGYDNVCDECGGQRFLPVPTPPAIAEVLMRLRDYATRLKGCAYIEGDKLLNETADLIERLSAHPSPPTGKEGT